MTEDVIVRSELIGPGPAEALAGLLDVGLPDLEAEGLPLLWHWLHLLERPRQEDLGADGHPVRGVIPAPPEPGRRRMWAGGRVRRLAPLRVGREAGRTTRVLSTTDKEGRSGRLTFVVVQHVISQDGVDVVVEEQDVVYRDAVAVTTPPDAEPVGEHAPLAAGDRDVPVDPTLLFRFSALTYNGHRIHYDRDYAREVEGYAGLVTHGPLQAVVMAEAARALGARGPLEIDYRLVSPLLDHQGLVVRADEDADGWVTRTRDLAGRTTAQGRVVALG
ncbi:MaoC family dehydratase N-terminal domain-containing protein [Nocardioides zeae]|uniref:MaoC family dehydratase N-terminal domain-containing protein n=1 Tax=Nocardioides imazamoxiresistens TaxID=3231893 RepID=A0ABU3PSG9_9ACTN|nr:MaoC family dehydratase N-terminal domain-containing protein [Nocardioides zeae]MDT9592172.1 MaoC family dehydratase N-terminal domain-containing protein [Nocardioides zeae]